MVDITGYHRTYASVLLRSPPPKAIIRKPRTARYSVETKQVVLLLWHATSNICAERLQPFMPELLDKLVACGELAVRPEIDDQLRQISLATVKRIVSREKRRSIIRIGGTTKPGSLLKRQISVRYGRWDETTPGWCETDTVAHCGDTLAGTFIYSLNLTDVATSWSEQVAIMGKGERASVTGLDSARKRLPFKLLGIDSDNGSEFINWHMARYAKNNRLTFTRSRPYRKNDQAHVEQKNWTAIRQLVGYQRMDTNEQLESLNDLYQNEWRQYLNFSNQL
ncbi:integrase [Candidatus Saccharibacteria bacterium]|nr:MAG: integrase [Candidatus Saccharibacteria bacterium]QQS20248.1 MAG: integrase [Candidatus Saccharibacteria bacterium]